MPCPHRLDLTAAERAELMHLRDSAAVPYLRERAAALLKVADGATAAHVARSGLLRRGSRTRSMPGCGATASRASPA